MPVRLIPGFGFADLASRSGTFLIPGAGYVYVAAPTGPTPVQRVAVILVNGRLSEIPANLRGTGLKPVVFLDGSLQVRKSTEGVPVVLVNGRLHTLPPGDTLII